MMHWIDNFTFSYNGKVEKKSLLFLTKYWWWYYAAQMLLDLIPCYNIHLLEQILQDKNSPGNIAYSQTYKGELHLQFHSETFLSRITDFHQLTERSWCPHLQSNQSHHWPLLSTCSTVFLSIPHSNETFLWDSFPLLSLLSTFLSFSPVNHPTPKIKDRKESKNYLWNFLVSGVITIQNLYQSIIGILRFLL